MTGQDMTGQDVDKGTELEPSEVGNSDQSMVTRSGPVSARVLARLTASVEADRLGGTRRGATQRHGNRTKMEGTKGGDPEPLGKIVNGVVEDHGWQESLVVGVILEKWPDIVGPDVANHVVVRSVEGGVLLLEATSTTWATQVRLLRETIVGRLRDTVEGNAVREIEVHGPRAPSWQKGPWKVTGRGPRDTYG